MKLRDTLTLTVAIVICELAGVVGSIFTVPSIPTWYATLVKPTLNPPSWVFAPVWTVLFALMGIALFLVWKKHSNILENVGMLRIRKWSVGLFFIQLTLNTLWSIIFFGFHNPSLALADIFLLWLAIVATIIFFYKISKPAAFLLLPYILWVSFAAYLNHSITVLN